MYNASMTDFACMTRLLEASTGSHQQLLDAVQHLSEEEFLQVCATLPPCRAHPLLHAHRQGCLR